jgi:hypothetical protein
MQQALEALPCCGYTDASAVKWNPFNGVVQCHKCGQVYSQKKQTNDSQTLEAILSVVCRYLPPDGISREQAMSEIIGLVDPGPSPLPVQPAFYQPAANEAVEILKSLGYVYEPTYTGLAWAKKSAQPEQEQALKKLADLGQEIEQEPTCPKCKAAVLYECVACSSNNYPPKPEQEPVAFAAEIVEDVNGVLSTQWADWWIPNEGDKLYTTLPAAQRSWQGLDEDDIRKLYGKDLNYRDGNYVRYAMAVEAKLKEKNT